MVTLQGRNKPTKNNWEDDPKKDSELTELLLRYR